MPKAPGGCTSSPARRCWRWTRRTATAPKGLAEGAVLDGAGVQIQVWATPGHTADSLSFVLPDEPGAAPRRRC